MILAAKLRGQTMKEIQKDFRISQATAYRALSHARKSGILAQAHDFLTEQLVPKALAAYDHILTHSDDDHLVKEVADKVLEGLGVIGKHASLTVTTAAPTETFEQFRLAVTRRVVTTGDHHPGVPAGDPSRPQEGELLPPAGSLPILDVSPVAAPGVEPGPDKEGVS
jgi:hypothetical protein